MRLEDCENAEYNQEEIALILHKLNKNNLLQALTARRFDCVQVQFAKTKTSYNEPSYLWVDIKRQSHTLK